MDLEAIPIQIPTPSKEDEDETLPEPNDPLEPFMTDEQFAEQEAKDHAAEKPQEPAEEEKSAEPMDEETRDDEIVVGDANDEVVQQNGHRGRDSSLSSAPGSEAEDTDDPTDIVVEKPKPTAPVGAKGIKLGDVEGARARLDKRLGSDELLKIIHRLLYKRAGTAHEVKKNIRDFSGFHFADKDARQSMRDKVAKLMTVQLKDISALFGLQVSGAKDSLVDALVEYMDAPWDTKKAATKARRRSSGKVGKPLAKKKSTEKIKVSKKRKVMSEENVQSDEEPVSEEEEEEEEEASPPPKKKAKPNPRSKPKAKPKPAKARSPLLVESSDDDVPLRPAPSDADIKSAIRDFLHGTDLESVTKGMVKQALRIKYGDTVVLNKKAVIAEGIQEGMERS